MTDLVLVAIITAISPILGAVAVLWKMRQDRIQRAEDKAEAIAAREAIERDALAAREALLRKAANIESLVDGKSDETKAEIIALKLEVARLNRDRDATTPTITAGEGAPSEVGMKDGVVTAERVGPFPPHEEP